MRLHDAATRVWDSYREQGPGKVDSELYEAVATAAHALEAALVAGNEPLTDTVRRVRDLAHRCACTSLGLCFITGEAGLIPRPDQHKAYEEGLAAIRAAADRLRGDAET